MAINNPNDYFRNISMADYNRHMDALASIASNQYKTPSKQEQIAILKKQISEMTIQLERLTLDDPMQGPTQRQLNQHESMRNAWSEYLTIRKLALGE